MSNSLRPHGLSVPPGLSVQAVSQARILEWVANSSSGDLPGQGSEPMSPALQADSLPLSHQGSMLFFLGGGGGESEPSYFQFTTNHKLILNSVPSNWGNVGKACARVLPAHPVRQREPWAGQLGAYEVFPQEACACRPLSIVNFRGN